MAAKRDNLTLVDGVHVVLGLSSTPLDAGNAFDEFAEKAIIERTLQIDEETSFRRGDIMHRAIIEAQAGTAQRLGQALDSIAPGLSTAIRQIADVHADQPWRRARGAMPEILEKPDIMKLALAWLYWNTDADGDMFHTTRLNKFTNAQMVQAAILTHPAQGTMACPCCGQVAQITVARRLYRNNRVQAEIACSHCGHTQQYGYAAMTRTPREWRKAQIFACDCHHCRAHLEEGRRQLAASMATFRQRLVDRIRGYIADIVTCANRINAAELTIPQHYLVEYLGLEKQTLPGGGTYLYAHDAYGINKFVPGKTMLKSWWEIKNLLPNAGRLGRIVVKPLVDLDSDDDILRWYDQGRARLSWDTIRTVHDDLSAFRMWIDHAGNSMVMNGVLDIPVAIEVIPHVGTRSGTNNAKDDEAEQRQQKIRDAITLLRENGYTVAARPAR